MAVVGGEGAKVLVSNQEVGKGWLTKKLYDKWCLDPQDWECGQEATL